MASSAESDLIRTAVVTVPPADLTRACEAGRKVASHGTGSAPSAASRNLMLVFAARERWSWSREATRKFFREQLWGNVVIAVAIFALAVGFWLWRQSKAAQSLAANSLEALGLLVAASILVLLWLLAWNYIRAADKLQIQHLSPGPEAVAAERQRVRNLRSRVALIHTEGLHLEAEILRIRAAGHYWDPHRVTAPLPFERLRESGGQLAEDPRTTLAYKACSAVEREVSRLRRLVQDRWADLGEFDMLGPEYQVFEPPVQPEDDLDRTLQVIRQAVHDLEAALATLRA